MFCHFVSWLILFTIDIRARFRLGVCDLQFVTKVCDYF